MEIPQQAYNSMDERLTEMEEKIDTIDIKVSQVVEAIVGNSITKQGGLLKELDALHNKILYLEEKIKILDIKQSKYELFRNRIIWTAGVIVGGAATFKYALDIYEKFNK